VVVYRLICADTVEERILELSERKLVLDHMLMAGDGAAALGDGSASSFSMSEMWSILRHGAERVLRASGDESACATAQLDDIIDRALAPHARGDPAADAAGRPAGRPAAGAGEAPAAGAQARVEGVAGTIFELEASMDSEADRLATFKPRAWPHGARITRERLAAAGFFASPTPAAPDRVVCFACHNTLSEWQPDDDPWEEHCRHYPDCPFVQDSGAAPALGGPRAEGADQAGAILKGDLISIARSKGLPHVSVRIPSAEVLVLVIT
jgi:hypothetical protein